jgi:RimJ/RimL family protein N-acetyltransferase
MAADDGPVQVLTEQLRLEPVDSDHVDDLETLRSGPDVAFRTGPWTRSATQAWAAEMADKWRRDAAGKWMAYRLDDGELVGRGGLSWTELDGERRLEVGRTVREKHRRCGYATEIGRAGLDFAFGPLNAAEVVAFTEVHSHASRAVMVRLGMTEIGRLYRPGLLHLSFAVCWPVASGVRAGGWGLRRG